MRHAFVATFAALCTTAAAAPTASDLSMPANARSLKTGLWETTRHTEIDDSGMDLGGLDLSGLDPAARARVKAVLDKQAAERKARGGAPKVSTRTKLECVTQEFLDKRRMSLEPDGRPGGLPGDETCPPVVKSRTASKMVVVADCSKDGHPFHVDMTIDVRSSGELYMESTMTGGPMGGKPGKTKATFSSRWIGADCGNAPPAH